MENMKCYEIDINGKSFLYQNVYYESLDHNMLIGSKSLENELINSYKSDYAKRIHDIFYGFVDDELFEDMTYYEFSNYVYCHFDLR
jgi:hypothetical protein